MIYEVKKHDEASLYPLADDGAESENLWLLDLIVDIDICQKRAAQAITRLKDANTAQSNNVMLQLNLVNAYVEGNQFAMVSKISNHYPFDYPNSLND